MTNEASSSVSIVVTRDNILLKLNVISSRTHCRVFSHFSSDNQVFSLTCSAEELEHLPGHSFFPLLVEDVVKAWTSLFSDVSFELDMRLYLHSVFILVHVVQFGLEIVIFIAQICSFCNQQVFYLLYAY